MVVMQPRQWMTNMDLKDVYFHVPVVAVHHQFLRFSWLVTSYQFRILLFELSSASRIFTKTLEHIIALLMLPGVQLYTYFDDLQVMGETEVEVAQLFQMTIQVLVHAGVVVNLKKTELTLTQSHVYIGVRFQLDLGWLYLS